MKLAVSIRFVSIDIARTLLIPFDVTNILIVSFRFCWSAWCWRCWPKMHPRPPSPIWWLTNSIAAITATATTAIPATGTATTADTADTADTTADTPAMVTATTVKGRSTAADSPDFKFDLTVDAKLEIHKKRHLMDAILLSFDAAATVTF